MMILPNLSPYTDSVQPPLPTPMTEALVDGFLDVDLSTAKLASFTGGAALFWLLEKMAANVVRSGNVPAIVVTIGGYGLASLFMGLDLRETARSSKTLFQGARQLYSDPSTATAYTLGNAFQGFLWASITLLPAIKGLRLAKSQVLRFADENPREYPGWNGGWAGDDVNGWVYVDRHGSALREQSPHPRSPLRPDPASDKPDPTVPQKKEPPSPRQEY